MIKICMVFPDCSTVATYKNRQKYLCWFDEFSASEFEQHNDTGFEYWIVFWIVFIPVPVAILNIKGTCSSFGFWILTKFWRIKGTCSSFEFWMDSECCSLQKGLPRHPSLPVAGTVTQNQHLALVDRRDSIHINWWRCISVNYYHWLYTIWINDYICWVFLTFLFQNTVLLGIIIMHCNIVM